MHQMTTLTVNIMFDILLDEVVLGSSQWALRNTTRGRGATLSLCVGVQVQSPRTNCSFFASLALIAGGLICRVIQDLSLCLR